MKKYIINIIIFLLPFILVTSIPSYFLMKSGENFLEIEKVLKTEKKYLLGYAYNQGNTRYIKWHQWVNKDRKHIITVGSSRVLQFRKAMFDTTFYNAGYTVRKISGFHSLLSSVPKKKFPKILIIGLDQWMFNKNWFGINTKKDTLFWSKSFNKYPKYITIENVYSDLFENKYTLGTFEKKSDTLKIGLNAIVNNKGMRNDGSTFYGILINHLLNDDGKQRDFHYQKTFNSIKKGKGHFEYGKHVSQNSIEELDKLLSFCKEHGIFVVGFLPPFADAVYQKMKLTGNYQYVLDLYTTIKPIFNKYNFEFYDYSSVKFCQSNDSETIDGFHGGEVTYQKILINMLEQGSVLNKTTDINRLKKDINNSINRYMIYNY